MNIIKYIRSSLLKIIYTLSVFLIVNIVIISSFTIKSSYQDVRYLNFLLMIISLLYYIIDYRKWNANFSQIITAIKNCCFADSYIPDIKGSFELNIIKEIVKLKNSEMEIKVDKVKSLLDDENDYITKWIHEIKIPVSVCELIADKIDSIENVEDVGHISEELRIESEKIRFLVEQVLYTSRASSYSEDLQINEINIGNVMKDVLRKNAVFFISKNIDIKVDNIDCNVLTDEKWISYIINQIINNAYKYTNKGGSIKIKCINDEKTVKLFIRDNGIGISEKDIRRIFDKGFTGTNGRIRQKSTGMGLYISKKMANKLNHGLLVNSKEGAYTEFIICFYKLSDYFNMANK